MFVIVSDMFFPFTSPVLISSDYSKLPMNKTPNGSIAGIIRRIKYLYTDQLEQNLTYAILTTSKMTKSVLKQLHMHIGL
ncbi:hypothetical protein VNO80_29344 [Phaseolus coccineus]|uniref:Uncharacterized protein n=1 Tax=Phaseolus coccineus TaxID=3886 RepID=A0AAN9LC18_PHACN